MRKPRAKRSAALGTGRLPILSPERATFSVSVQCVREACDRPLRETSRALSPSKPPRKGAISAGKGDATADAMRPTSCVAAWVAGVSHLAHCHVHRTLELEWRREKRGR